MQNYFQQQPLYQAQQIPQIAQTPFGIMVPGQIAVTQFEQCGNLLVHTLINPVIVHSVSFFLFTALEQGVAACLYFSAPPFEGMQFMGAIANARPSDIFQTHFSLNPDVNTKPEVKLIVQLQPMDEKLQQLVNLTNTNDLQIKCALAIAQNLHNYMSSFSTITLNDKNQQVLITPINVVDNWIERFQAKYRMDPNFIFKTTK